MKKLTIFGLLLLFMASCTEENITLPEAQPEDVSDDIEATVYMDELLCSYYLYAEEYASITRDTDMMYDDFLETTLTSMQTNTLDYKNGYLYSFVTRTARSAASLSSRSSAIPDSGMSLGFVSFTLTTYGSSNSVALGVNGVYKESSAEEIGFVRGYFITHVNGEELTTSNYYDSAVALLYPSDSTPVELTVELTTSALVSSSLTAQTVSISAKETEYNPVLKSEIYNDNIGYLVYSSFIKSTTRLEEAMASFAAAGVTDLILDLRLNGGGYNDSANVMASCIAGSAHVGDLFNKRIYNPYISDSDEFFMSVSGSPYLGLSRIYCLVSDSTASASELVINGLEGIDIEVILIGETTNGKNVGMYEFIFSTESWTYEFYPICFRSVNAKDWGSYENGFTPDYYVDEWNGGANFSDFTQSEALVAKAISLISGEATSSAHSISKSGASLSKREVILGAGQFNGSIAVK
ncbi:MAG: S41 family peptidase [Rikenellaceae bacterium]